MKFTLKFVVVILLITINNSLSYAMESSSTVSSQKAKVLTAQERLTSIKGMLAKNPDLTMFDPLPEILYDWYERDRAFIREQIETPQIPERRNVSWLQERLAVVDSFKESRGEDLSLSDYNFIGELWSRYISEAAHGTFFEPSINFDSYLKLYEESLFAAKKGINLNSSMRYLTTKGIVLPHISKTGLVSVTTMNSGFGFFSTKDRSRTNFISFFAVGTNENHKYHGLENRSSFQAYLHDQIHYCGLYQGTGKLSTPAMVYKMAHLREEMDLLSLSKSHDERAALELTFFFVFHEAPSFGTLGESISCHDADVLEIKIREIKEQAKTDSGNTVRFEDRIFLAESILKRKLSGANIYEKYIDFLRLRHLGGKILKSIAFVFDDTESPARILGEEQTVSLESITTSVDDDFSENDGDKSFK